MSDRKQAQKWLRRKFHYVYREVWYEGKRHWAATAKELPCHDVFHSGLTTSRRAARNCLRSVMVEIFPYFASQNINPFQGAT